MRQRPVRSQIYLPVVAWGVADRDWKWVYVSGLACYAVPFALNLSYRGFPLAIPIGPAGFAVAMGFFAWARRGRRANWLQHVVLKLVTPARRRQRTPRDSARRGGRGWIRRPEV